MTGFTHFDAAGNAAMVDVGAKPETARAATARARVVMQPATLQMILQGHAKKGDVLGVARLAGIMGAKRTADLIPLCHPLPISAVTVDLTPEGDDAVEITATVRTTGRTGVEMEAPHRRQHRRPDRLRHVQGGGSRHADRGAAGGGQIRRQVRRFRARLAAPRRHAACRLP